MNMSSRHLTRPVFGFATLFVAIGGCASTQTQPRSSAPATSSDPSSEPALADARWAGFTSRRFGMRLAFPQGPSWRIDDHSHPWLVARHPASSSVFHARVWHEPSAVNWQRCEDRAKLWLTDLPGVEELSIVDDRMLDGSPGPGFQTHLLAGVRPGDSQGRAARGVVMAVGAAMKKCVALVMMTDVSGASAAADVGERLGLGVRMLENAQIVNPLEPEVRVPR